MQSILNYRFRFLQDKDDSDIIKMLESPVIDNTRMLIEQRASGEFDGIFVFLEIMKERVYDFDKEDFIDIISQKSNTVDFSINIPNEILEIWGSRKGAQRVIGALSQLLQNQIIVEQYEISFEKAIEYLKDCNIVSVGKVKAKEIVIENGLIADCTFDLSFAEKPFYILNKYKKSIDRIRFDLETDKVKVGITLYRSGLISVHKSKEFISNEIMVMIHRIINASRR